MEKADFFEDIAIAMDRWTSVVSSALTDSSAKLHWVEDPVPYQEVCRALNAAGVEASAVRQILSQCLRGFAISMLTVLDGGTAADEGGRVYVVDEDGNRLGEGLHDEFVTHLLDTNRMT